MIIRTRENLTVIALPPGRKVVDAPPVLAASTHTVDYCCGSCGTILMHAEGGPAHGLIIHCVPCDAYNATEQ